MNCDIVSAIFLKKLVIYAQHYNILDNLDTAHQDRNKSLTLSTLKQLKSLYFVILTNSEQKNRLCTVSKKDTKAATFSKGTPLYFIYP